MEEDLNAKKKRRGQKHYGRKMTLSKRETHLPSSQETSFSFVSRNGKEIFVEASYWKDIIFRSSKEFSAHKHPFSLYQYRLRDAAGKLLYSRPLWLVAFGGWREELSLEDCFYHYQGRYDIEHFFRFGKNNVDKTTHFENNNIETHHTCFLGET